jgi:hypothetical protein
VDNLQMPNAPFTSLDDMVETLAAWEDRYRQHNDRRAIFVTLYRVVSTAMRARVQEGAFLDPAWVHRLAVAFGNLFRAAVIAYDAGRRDEVPKAWRICFDAARAGRGLVLQDMFLGVNAHVNNDLPLALSTVSIDPDRPKRHQDHAAVNAVLGSVTEEATTRIAALYAPGLPALDAAAGQVDETVSLFSLELARDSAWEAAVSLANARNSLERDLVVRLIGVRAAALARLLTAPSANPLLVEASRGFEQGTGWQRLLVGVKLAARA